jgi:hypothetical protein
MCFFVCGVSISLWKERTNTNFVTKFGFGQKKNFYKGTFFLIGSSLLGLVLKHWYLLPFLVKREKYNKQ